jgi:hypothetical protein
MALPCLLALALAPSQSFATRLIPLEGQVKRAAFVDLDRDGAVDVLAEKTNALSWLAGDGAGGFAAPRLVAGGSGWTPLFFRDLDGDGALDALAIRATAGELVFVKGVGGGFATPTVVALGNFRMADASDLDGDGDLDLIAWDEGISSVRAFRQVAGAWIPAGGAALTQAAVQALAFEDFDQDGAGDVALSLFIPGPIPQPRVVLLHGNGNGSFGQRWSATLPAASSLDSADLDGDGAPELVATAGTKLFGVSHRGQRQYSISALATAWFAPSKLGDADSDGDVDLLVATPEGVRLHLNDGLGRFPQSVNLLTHPSASGVDLADLDGDGACEIVGPAGQNWIALTSSNGRGGWDDLHVGRSISSRPVAAGDIDGDGIEELLLDMTSRLEFARSNGQGQFEPAQQIPISASNGAFAIDLRDLDADGDLDVLLRQWTGDYEYLANDGSGQFVAPVALPMQVDDSLQWADFDGDGNDDALALSNGPMRLYRGLAGGGFAPPVPTPHPNVLTFRALTDVDGDAACDVVLVRPAVGLEIWSCGPGGVFALRSSMSVPGFAQAPAGVPWQIGAGDFDGDGFGDVVWVDRVAGLVRCARGSAAGTLAAPVDSAALIAPDFDHFDVAVVRDIDGDGLPDLILRPLPGAGPLRPALRLSLGGGRFSRPSKFATGANSALLVLIDIDGDGRRDLVMDNLSESRPIVLLQR